LRDHSIVRFRRTHTREPAVIGIIPGREGPGTFARLMQFAGVQYLNGMLYL